MTATAAPATAVRVRRTAVQVRPTATAVAPTTAKTIVTAMTTTEPPTKATATTDSLHQRQHQNDARAPGRPVLQDQPAAGGLGSALCDVEPQAGRARTTVPPR